MVAAGENIRSSGREICFLACNLPVSGIIIIGPGALTMLSKHC